MAVPPPPASYATFKGLPEVSFRHVPASSPTVTRTVVVLIDRPAKNNAFTDTMTTSLTAAFAMVSADPRVKAVVLAGNDPRNKFFCAGMDLDGAAASQASLTPEATGRETPAETAALRENFRDGGGSVSLAIYNCRKPVVAAINGHAVGVGMTMTLPCTLRVVSSQARVGFVFSRRGITMEACSSFFLPRLLGAAKALHLVATGATFKPTDFPIRDLFAEVIEDPASVVPRAVEMAEELAAKTSPLAVQTMKEMIFRGPESPEEATLLESRVFFDMFRGRDSKEGILSFLQKRDPDFKATWEQDRPVAWPWSDLKDVYVGQGGSWKKSKI